MAQSSIVHHHITKRKKDKDSKHKKFVDKFVYVVGVLTPLFTLPQVLKIWMNKSAENISIFTWVPYLLFAFIWLWYGIIHREKPIIFLNLGLVIVDSLVVLGIMIY
ncbi:hypothetical protein GF361_02565 [Candidatus Woesearchaeota archaeon]|nr:hypothetical protein [Candidatus Woesearchaeota archaeon]